MIQKIIDCESLENLQENVYDGVCFSKVPHLQRTDFHSTISRLHHRTFLEFVPKISCFKNVLEKMLWCTSILMKPKHRMRSLQFYKKGARVRPLWRSAENFNVFKGKSPRWKLLFNKVARLESNPAILLKTFSCMGSAR